MTQPPPPPYGPEQFPTGPMWVPVTPPPAAERVRAAWQRRYESDYIFDFWSALGWTFLTLGFYSIYVVYQLTRRSRDHNLRRAELLDAATIFAWEQAQAKGMTEELRPGFERISQNMMPLRRLTSEFRDPTVWALLCFFTGIATWILYIFLDGDLVTHDHAEGAIEADLSEIYARLGAPVPPPDPSRLKAKHNYAGRIVATLASCGVYGAFWLYNVMTEGNRHFEHNWRWEDGLAQSVQSLLPSA